MRTDEWAREIWQGDTIPQTLMKLDFWFSAYNRRYYQTVQELDIPKTVSKTRAF
jgi:hypothetical protein